MAAVTSLSFTSAAVNEHLASVRFVFASSITFAAEEWIDDALFKDFSFFFNSDVAIESWSANGFDETNKH